jgi:hypothetical protein
MLTRDMARLQVILELRRRYGVRLGPDELIVRDEHTIERPWGWVFFFINQGYLDGDDNWLCGNGPVLVNRHDGAMQFCGTAYVTEHYIEEYEAELAEKLKR